MLKFRYPFPFHDPGGITLSFCGGGGVELSELAPQPCTCARMYNALFFPLASEKEGTTIPPLGLQALWDRKKSPLRSGTGCPVLGWDSQDWTPFPIGHRGAAHGPFPWSTPCVGDAAPSGLNSPTLFLNW